MPDLAATDYHTAGEPFRIVTAGTPAIPGATVRERRLAAMADPDVDGVRRLLCQEPRGHADMYGGFLVPPDDPGADLGVLFWHKDGFSTACGHGTIALATWAVDTGRVPAPSDGVAEVRIDVPSGRVLARVVRHAGRVEQVTFVNVPAYVLARAVPVSTSFGAAEADVAYGGAIYASVRAADLGLEVVPGRYGDLVAAGREVKSALAGHPAGRHPADPSLSGIYGTILWDDLGAGAAGPRHRNVAIFADGEVDRSPCGSGTSARVALLHADGLLESGQVLEHASIIGTRFTARVVARVRADGRDAVVAEVDGTAFPTGEHRFVLDPRDPVGLGFVLR